jgi:Domain of unknown function (DUF4389)
MSYSATTPGMNYPAATAIDYPDRPLDRLNTAFRIIYAIPILVIAALIGGGTVTLGTGSRTYVFTAAGGIVVLAPALMIIFRQRYPRWWFDWNFALLQFSTRITAFMALMDDRYPSTEDEQSVHITLTYPDVRADLNRWLPIVKWLLAIPHYVALFFLSIGAVLGAIAAWFAILFTGRYPRGIFDYIEGVIRWHVRVVAYAALLVTDEYPPFTLAP